MPEGPIAETLRTRMVKDDCLDESDIVVCFADDEADLLECRPDLLGYDRIATKHLDPAVVLFVPTAATPGPGLGLWPGTEVSFPLSAVYRYIDRP